MHLDLVKYHSKPPHVSVLADLHASNESRKSKASKKVNVQKMQ